MRLNGLRETSGGWSKERLVVWIVSLVFCILFWVGMIYLVMHFKAMRQSQVEVKYDETGSLRY